MHSNRHRGSRVFIGDAWHRLGQIDQDQNTMISSRRTSANFTGRISYVVCSYLNSYLRRPRISKLISFALGRGITRGVWRGRTPRPHQSRAGLGVPWRSCSSPHPRHAGQLGRTHNSDVFARRFEPASTPALTAERPHGVAPPAGNVAVVTMHLETGTATSADLRSATTADRLPADPRCAARRAGRSAETRRETGLGRHDGGAA